MLKVRKKNRWGRSRAILWITIVCFAAGFAVGGFSVLGMDEIRMADAAMLLTDYFETFPQSARNNGIIFRESFIIHVQLIVVIWFLGFTPIGALGVLLLLLFRGAGYGFTTVLLFQSQGLGGLLLGAALYLPQALLMTLAYLLAAYANLQHSLTELNGRRNTRTTRYVAPLVVGSLASALAALLDTFPILALALLR